MPIDFSNAWKTAVKLVNDAISMLPNVVIAFLLFLLFLGAASFFRSFVRRIALQRQKHQGIALLLGRLAYTSIVILGFLVALSVVAPSFRAADLIKVLGVGTVAIGFAFQNILQNFLAGILLLLQEPFRIGDFISVTGIEGVVHDVQSRATVITSKDGREVIIPNALIFTSPVAVEHAERQPVPQTNPSATQSTWREMFKTAFRRPASPGAK
jgi:small conductance mechanosensitive channel